MDVMPAAHFKEKIYTPEEVAKLLHMSMSWVYRTFRHYPGVLCLGKPKLGKRSYLTLRIPESVLQQWIREHSASPPQ